MGSIHPQGQVFCQISIARVFHTDLRQRNLSLDGFRDVENLCFLPSPGVRTDMSFLTQVSRVPLTTALAFSFDFFNG